MSSAKYLLLYCSTEIIFLLLLPPISYGNYRNDIPLSAILQIKNSHDSNDPYYTGGKFIFRCDAHSFMFEEGFVWLFKHGTINNGTFIKQIPKEHISYIPDSRSSHFSQNPHSIVEITFPEKSIIEVICAAPRMYSKTKWATTFVNVIVRDSIFPNITSDHVDNYFKIGQKGQSVTCKAEGFPMPKIIWTFNGTEIGEDDPYLEILDKVLQKNLLFPQFSEKLAGDYVCTASNILGNHTKVFHVRTLVEDSNSNSSVPWTGIFVGLAVFLIFAAVVPYCYLERLKSKKKQNMKEIGDLLNGASNGHEVDADGSENPIILFPYDKKYELRKSSFSVDNVELAKGNYGVVYKGRVQGVDGLCAFKTLPKCYTMSELRNIVYELKIFNYVGRHENIVHLVGAYTKDLFEGKIYIVTQLCSLGSLDDYLSSNKSIFIQNIIDSKDNDSEMDSFSICTYKRLLIWSKQIANALDYIWSKRVLHGDVATRNVLLTADGVAKVTDFGLSRTLDSSYKYIKQHNDVLPWQWLAVESLKMNEFSVHSDIWAYGITLWEIFTLGEIPYPGMKPPKNGTMLFWTMFIAQLENGHQNEIPQYASPQIYDIMKSCWKIEPTSRPTFSSLKDTFHTIIKDWRQHTDKIKTDIDCETTLRLRRMPKENDTMYTTLETLPVDFKLSDEQTNAVQNGYVLQSCVDNHLSMKEILF